MTRAAVYRCYQGLPHHRRFTAPRRGSAKRLPLRVAALVALLTAGACSADRGESISHEELVHRTQVILDSVAGGDRKPFELYFADDAMDHDEKGRAMDKKALVADITLPPRNWSGSIKLSHPESRIVGTAAILSYDVDETEVISGQTVQARYHTTDTWLQRRGSWQIVAEQVLRYYDDPAQGKPDIARYPDYAGSYEVEPGKTREVSSQAESLFMQSSGKEKEALFNEAGDLFFRKGVEGRILFHRTAQGKVDALIDRRNNEDIVWRKVT